MLIFFFFFLEIKKFFFWHGASCILVICGMSMIQKVWESKTLIRFPDCDPFNHLNNARYLDYFMNAREDHLMRGMEFNIYKIAQEQGVSWVVASHRIAYLRPAMLMETVTIDSTLLAWRERD